MHPPTTTLSFANLIGNLNPFFTSVWITNDYSLEHCRVPAGVRPPLSMLIYSS